MSTQQHIICTIAIFFLLLLIAFLRGLIFNFLQWLVDSQGKSSFLMLAASTLQPGRWLSDTPGLCPNPICCLSPPRGLELRLHSWARLGEVGRGLGQNATLETWFHTHTGSRGPSAQGTYGKCKPLRGSSPPVSITTNATPSLGWYCWSRFPPHPAWALLL